MARLRIVPAPAEGQYVVLFDHVSPEEVQVFRPNTESRPDGCAGVFAFQGEVEVE